MIVRIGRRFFHVAESRGSWCINGKRNGFAWGTTPKHVLTFVRGRSQHYESFTTIKALRDVHPDSVRVHSLDME